VTTEGNRQRVLESGLLEDIHIIPNARSNSILIFAPEKTMQLLMGMIDQMDVLRSAIIPKVTVYPLKHADAELTATLLQQLLFGGGTTGGAARPGGTAGGLVSGGGGPATSGILPTTGLGGEVIGGTPLLDLRISVDDRTNSIILSGQLEVVTQVEELVNRLDLATQSNAQRRNEVYSLHNASAADVANALNTYFANQLSVQTTAGYNSAFLQIQQQVIVVPEPITNKLLISATDYFFGDIMRFIAELDAQPPQVVIQCLLAEVDLSATEEFGVEIGLQSPVLFQRGNYPPAAGATTTYTSSASTAAGLTATGVGSPIPGSSLGYLFNNNGNPLGNNVTASPSTVGFQGISNLGVGRSDPNLGIGGFVFSASSNVFSLLIRALKVQGRMDILSRPQLTTLDNQTANILVGTSVPYSTGTAITGTGIVSSGIGYRDTGVLMNVTPRISPDGRVLMRVQPEVSKVSATSISLGNGVTAPEFDVQSVQTTVAVNDGDTVVIGGLIAKADTKNENKVPWLGDLPYVGSCFRYRTQSKAKRELIIILTPHVVRSKADADRIMYEEARRMDWIVGDVLKTHGTSGMGPIMPIPGGVDGHMPAQLPAGGPGYTAPFAPVPFAPAPVYPAPAPAPAPTSDGSVLPTPTLLPPGAQGQAPAPAPGMPRSLPAQAGQPAWVDMPGSAVPHPSTGQTIAPLAPKQEDVQWTVPPSR